MIEDYMTTQEAAEYLDYKPEYICNLCSKGKLPGAQKMGKRIWVIPKEAVYGYKPGLQGFAATKAREQAEMEEWRTEARRVANIVNGA